MDVFGRHLDFQGARENTQIHCLNKNEGDHIKTSIDIKYNSILFLINVHW